LARALGDPTATLVHAGPHGWIDAAGRPVAVSSDSGDVTTIVAGGRPVSALVHSQGGKSELVEDVAATARLALAHQRLQALRQAQLAELRASRARIVETADAERRRLERDLHDGAQQRVVALSLAVRLARRRATDTELGAGLAAAEEELRLAAVELREFAHGVFPAALAEEGFGPAVEVLAEQYPRLRVEQLPDARPPAPVESAAYVLISETLRRAPDHDITLHASLAHGRLVLELRGAFEPVPTELEDRVGAVGGTVTVDADRLRVEIACGS